jgi:hypothetical protein
MDGLFCYGYGSDLDGLTSLLKRGRATAVLKGVTSELYTLIHAATLPSESWEPDDHTNYISAAFNTAISAGYQNIGFYCPNVVNPVDSPETILFNNYPVDNVSSSWHNNYAHWSAMMQLIDLYASSPVSTPIPTTSSAIVAFSPFAIPANVPLNEVTHVILERLVPTSASDMTLISDQGSLLPIPNSISMCQTAGVKCLIELFNGYTNTSYNAIFDSSALRSQLIVNLYNFITYYGLDGVALDWESDGSANLGNYATFYSELYAVLNPAGKIIRMTANFSPITISIATASLLEGVDVMTFDAGTKSWELSLADMQTTMTTWSNWGIPKNKLTAGISFAARYGSGVDRTSYANVVNYFNPSSDANTVSDNTGHFGQIGTLYYNGPTLAGQKAQWLKDNGYQGVMVNNLSLDVYNSQSLLLAVYNASPTPSPTVTPTPTPSPTLTDSPRLGKMGAPSAPGGPGGLNLSENASNESGNLQANSPPQTLSQTIGNAFPVLFGIIILVALFAGLAMVASGSNVLAAAVAVAVVGVIGLFALIMLQAFVTLL